MNNTEISEQLGKVISLCEKLKFECKSQKVTGSELGDFFEKLDETLVPIEKIYKDYISSANNKPGSR